MTTAVVALEPEEASSLIGKRSIRWSPARGFLVGIKPEDITIIDDSTLVHFRGVSDDPRTNPRFNSMRSPRRNTNAIGREKIYDRLRHYDPNVQVNVELR
ncbi:MAG: hypothetical protein R3B96_09060 [Pirellulaceae bacterium]